jgi:hypothetical protein
MVGKQGEGVAKAFDDLILSEVASESEVGALKSRACELGAAKSVRFSNVWLKSALVRLAPSTRASVKSAPDRSALARFAPESVAKRNDAPRPCRGEVDRAAVHGAQLPRRSRRA